MRLTTLLTTLFIIFIYSKQNGTIEDFNIEIESVSNTSFDIEEPNDIVKSNQLLKPVTKDSFFEGITMKSYRNKDKKNHNSVDINIVNQKFRDGNGNSTGEINLPEIIESDFDLDEDLIDQSNKSNSNNQEIIKKDNLAVPGKVITPISVQESSIISEEVDTHVFDRIHFAPDSYEDTEATTKRISRLFTATPQKIVPVITNCNRPAIDFFFKGSFAGDLDETFMEDNYKLTTEKLGIINRLDNENQLMCSFLDMSCCTNEELDNIRKNLNEKTRNLERFKMFVNQKHDEIFSLVPENLSELFKGMSDGFINQCVGNHPGYVRNLITYISSKSFVSELNIDSYINSLQHLGRYLSCKLCDASDNHRTFYFDKTKSELQLMSDESLAMHLINIKLKEIAVSAVVRKLTIISKLTLCRIKRVASLGWNENENGSIRWVQNFYRKCKGEMIYLLPKNFQPPNELISSPHYEDLNEFSAFQMPTNNLKMKNSSISKKCQKVLFKEDSHILNFRDDFDIIRLTQFNSEVLIRLFKFVKNKKLFGKFSGSDWRNFETTFDFSTTKFIEDFEERRKPIDLKLERKVQAEELYPFVFSPLSVEFNKISHKLTLNLYINGIEYKMLKNFQKQLQEGVTRILTLVLCFVWLTV